MANGSRWNRPGENTYVTIDDEDIQVPYVDDYLWRCIQVAPRKKDCAAELLEIVNWLKSLSDKEVEAGHHFYHDRWTWDNGHLVDKALMVFFEKEKLRRRSLKHELSHVLSAQRVMELLDEIADRKEQNERDTELRPERDSAEAED